ncbi:MAG TPA: tRNA threonylcarbamoyladenosine dehydratase [Candidatus Pullichristensenella avicola]|nr:tRNA threonylcarbamoyladenosine dehydratase [Candidatus Pullichristensenella avicola]
MDMFDRTRRLIGAEALERLRKARVIIFGLGGVGGSAAEALVRAGVGRLTFVDADCVDATNLNRQIVATQDTVGMPKAEAMRARALAIFPEAQIEAVRAFYDAHTADRFDLRAYDYVADAIDSVSAKLLLIERATAAGTPIISAMGAGNKLDPSRFRVADIYATSICPLARVMRRELKKRGIARLKTVYSDEEPLPPQDGERSPASISFVPPAAGLVLAGAIVRDLIGAAAP